MHDLDKWEWLDEAMILETKAEETKARETKAKEIKAKKTKVKKAVRNSTKRRGVRRFAKECVVGMLAKARVIQRLRSLRKLIGWGSDVRLSSASWLCCGVAVSWNYTFPSEDLVTEYRPVNLV
jgi:hypothetical protein